jgi:hypothetical protein
VSEEVSKWVSEATHNESASPSHTHSRTYPFIRSSSFGDILRVKPGETLKNIDLRFAPFKKGTWKNYTYLDGLADNYVLAIHRNPDGRMWFGTEGGGVSVYDGKTFKNFTTQDGLVNNFVYAIHRDSDGVMWFGTSGGVSRYIPPHSPLAEGGSKGRFINFTTQDGLANNRVSAIHCAPDGVMWFGTNGGVSRYIPPHSPLAKGGSKGGFVNFTTEDGLANNDVRCIHCAPDGTL